MVIARLVNESIWAEQMKQMGPSCAVLSVCDIEEIAVLVYYVCLFIFYQLSTISTTDASPIGYSARLSNPCAVLVSAVGYYFTYIDIPIAIRSSSLLVCSLRLSQPCGYLTLPHRAPAIVTADNPQPCPSTWRCM